MIRLATIGTNFITDWLMEAQDFACVGRNFRIR